MIRGEWIENVVQHQVGSGNEGALCIRRVMGRLAGWNQICYQHDQGEATRVTYPFIVTQNEARQPDARSSD